jgi:hypothetical protein
LAVLSDGTGDTSCSVKLFDPETGYISSTHDIDIAKPMSLGVTLKHQYVILGENQEGQKQITVVDKDGVVEHEYVIDEGSDKVENPKQITCGGSFVFVRGSTKVAVYVINDIGLQRITTCHWDTTTNLCNISATIWDDIFITDINGPIGTTRDHVYLNRSNGIQDKENTWSWSKEEEKAVHENVRRADRKSRVSSTRDGFTVVLSHGQTIKVYKC